MAQFDPDAYLSAKPQQPSGFDPDAYLRAGQPATPTGQIPGAGGYIAPPAVEQRPSRTQTLTDVLNRGLVASTLGAPVDIAAMAMRPFGYREQQPFMGSEFIGRQMEQAGMVSPTRRPLGELAAGFAPALVTGGAALARQAPRFVSTAIGTPAKQAAEALRARTAEALAQPISEAEQARQRAAGVVQQMERQPAVAAERAARAPLTPEQQAAALQAEVRQPVREAAGAARVRAEDVAAQATAQRQSAEQAVTALEQRLLAQPRMSAEQFGQELRATTQKLYNDLVKARAQQSGLSAAIQSAGTEPTVNTAGLIARAEDIATTSRNPTVIAMMNEIASLAKTGEARALSLESADSLRKTLGKDIINKYFPQTGADKEVLNSLRQLRGDLIKQTPQPYREALARYSVLSRPLDIMERQGALKRVLDVDPLSTAEKLTEAEVVGQVINKARAGNETFARLLQANPQLKDSGRLYFTQDLFSKDVVPTEASLRTWLRANERPLRQLGLYDEFKDLRSAREAAQRSLNEAKSAETVAEKAATEARKVSKTAEQRLREALKVDMGPAVTAKPPPVQTFVQTREKAQETVNTLNRLQSDVLAAKTPEEVRKAVTTTANQLLKSGVIDDAGYRTILRDVESLKSLEQARTQTRKVLAYFAGLAGLGYVGRGAISSQFETR